METERSYSIKIERGTPVQLFCPVCGQLSEMLSVNEAADETEAERAEPPRRANQAMKNGGERR